MTDNERIYYAHIIPAPAEVSFAPDDEVDINGWGFHAATGISAGIRQHYLNHLPIKDIASAHQISLELASAMKQDAYELSVKAEILKVKASTDRGFFYALQTIKQYLRVDCLPQCHIVDSPRLKLRGFHLSLEYMRQVKIDDIITIIEKAASWKLNTVLLEYGDRFPFRKHSIINSRDAFSKEQIQRIVECAKDNFIEIIPLIQTFGHLEYALKHDQYSHLREVPTAPQQLCPTNEHSLVFIKELLDEISSMHPHSQKIHIGVDETRQLGECPRCAAKVADASIGKLYLDYVNNICAYLVGQNITPMVWDDIFCAHPDMLQHLDPHTVIVYWDYWSRNEKSPLLVTRYQDPLIKEPPSGVLYDKYWTLPENKAIYKNLKSSYSHPADLTALGNSFMKIFGDYLGSEFLRLIRSFPYLEYYRDHGFRVVGAPSCLGERFDFADGLENFERTIPNMRGFAYRCATAEAEGMITTAWFNYPAEFIYYGLIATAQFCWRAEL